MSSNLLSPMLSSQVDCEALRDKWNNDPFFAPDTVVLGLDIGIEGIGIAVRRGTEWLYAKTLLVDLPEAQALAERRAFRAARHARKNRRTRMRRLQELFATHGLPWVDDEVMSRSDPFKLRYRAITGTLASREALSICIRSCVLRRGYDYFAMNDEDCGGEMPWGTGYVFKDAVQWLRSAYVDDALKKQLMDVMPLLTTANNKELDDKKRAEWEQLVIERFRMAKTIGIPATLRDYVKSKLNERKARGRNYPRAHVEAHLRDILHRHSHLIDRYDDFVAALFRPCETREDKKLAIFHFNRKTPHEAALHYAGKVKRCPYCKWLDIPGERCGLTGDKDIRKWKLIDFVSTRTFELLQNKIPIGRQYLPGEAVKVLMQAIEQDCKTWSAAKKMMTDSLKALSISLASGQWNNAQGEQLGDIVAPSVSRKKGRAAMSSAAARAMVAAATNNGTDFEPEHLEQWKKDSGLYTRRAEIDACGGIYPQVQTLLGTLRKQKDGQELQFATQGFLQRLFTKTLKDKLGGKTVPDFCVVECIKNPAINKERAAEIEKEQKANRARRDKLVAAFNRSGKISNSDFLRMKLFTEQGGSPTSPAICPFTGQKLSPSELFTGNLQLAHLWPDSRGGLYMADNLVITTAEVNKVMHNMTPREAAQAILPGWSGWDEMQKRSRLFRWNDAKRSYFAATDFPDFNNMTRTAQLARELRRLVAVWMGIGNSREALRIRLGNPSGVYTAAARRSFPWSGYKKDRSDNTHHRFDAALMTCIPPTGINDVLYGGIFRTEKDEKGNRMLMCLDGLNIPDFISLKSDASDCPVIKINSRSKYKKLGDSTFWSVAADGKTHQREPLVLGWKGTSKELYDILRGMGIPPAEIPSEKELEKWLVDGQAATKSEAENAFKPLKLKNGTPVRNIWKFGGKGNMDNSPVGWSGVISSTGVFDQIRNLSEKYDRVEIWLGWNVKAKRWEYYKKLIPTAAALTGIKRMGLPWRGVKGAPVYLLNLLQKKKAKDLHRLVCGSLPSGAIKVGKLRKGDVFIVDFKPNEKYLETLQRKGEDVSGRRFSIKTWGIVTSVSKQSEIKSLMFKDRKSYQPLAADTIAELLDLPIPAAELAAKMHLTSPK